MSFKTIAIHLDGGPRCAVRVALAASLATRFEGKLVGITPTGVPEVVLGTNTPLPDGLEVVALSLALHFVRVSLRRRNTSASSRPRARHSKSCGRRGTAARGMRMPTTRCRCTASRSELVEPLVSRDRQELGEVLRERDVVEK